MQPAPDDDWPFPIPSAPMGALRILSRNDDAEVLIVHGEDRMPGPGEKLAWIQWFDSIEIAKAISHACSARLLAIPQFKPDAEGWHPFSAAHLKVLVAEAKTKLHLTIILSEPKPPTQYQAWTKERVARLAFLAGQGWTAKAIAADPLIRSTADAVYRAAHRYGAPLAMTPPGRIPLDLPPVARAYLERRAARDGMSVSLLARRLLVEIASSAEVAAA